MNNLYIWNLTNINISFFIQVTFKNHSSVSQVFRQSPITTANGAKLTVVLASANTKPRRAHFNVRHGTSGHKPSLIAKEQGNDYDDCLSISSRLIAVNV